MDTPWIGVFTFIARELNFWFQEVQIPAQNFLARGGKWMTKREAEVTNMPASVKDATNTKGREKPPGKGESKQARKRRRYRERQDWESSNAGRESSSWRGPGKGESRIAEKGNHQMAHPRQYSKFFVTDREGNQLCYRFAHARNHVLMEDQMSTARRPKRRAQGVAKASDQRRMRCMTQVLKQRSE